MSIPQSMSPKTSPRSSAYTGLAKTTNKSAVNNNQITVDYSAAPILARKNDRLAVIKVTDIETVTGQQVIELAAKYQIPQYVHNGSGIIVLLEVAIGSEATQTYTMGILKENWGLKDLRLADGSKYPLQLSAAIGGMTNDPNTGLRILMQQAFTAKMQFTHPSLVAGNSLALDMIFAGVTDKNNWLPYICVHTDKWYEGNKEKTMCYLTGLIKLKFDQQQFNSLQDGYKGVLNFPKLEDIIANSKEFYHMEEKPKAILAQQTNRLLTFNDLAITVLNMAGAFNNHKG